MPYPASARKTALKRGIVDTLARIARDKQVTPAQLALAWVLAQKPTFVPIPGTTKPHRLDENIAAIDIVLSAAELASIEEVVSGIDVQSERYSPQHQARIDR